MNDDGYGLKYAYIYTVLITTILLAPVFFYVVHMKNIYDIQNELRLKNKSYLIVQIMQEHNQNDDYFEYPRFKTFESGIYDLQNKAIFSLIKITTKITEAIISLLYFFTNFSVITAFSKNFSSEFNSSFTISKSFFKLKNYPYFQKVQNNIAYFVKVSSNIC